MIGRAYLTAAIVGATAPAVGVFMVQRRLALVGDGLGHLAFAGVALGAVLGANPLPVALGVALSGAILIEVLQRRGGARADVALSVIFYTGLAGGVLLLSTARSFNASALGILFGSLLTTSLSDLWTTGLVLGGVAFAVVVCYRKFFVLVLDEEAALVEGVGVAKVSTLLSALTAAVVVAGIRAVGVLLVAALMVMPAAAAQRVTSSFAASALSASVVGVCSSLLGVWIAIWSDIPPGATVVLVAVAIYLMSIPVGRAVTRVRTRDVRATTTGSKTG